MHSRRRQGRRAHLPGASGRPVLLSRNTLSSTQLPNFSFSVPEVLGQPSGSFRVPSPTPSEEEEIQAQEKEIIQGSLPSYPRAFATDHTPQSDSVGYHSDHPSRLGDSSSLFSEATPDFAQAKPKPFQFGSPETARQTPLKFDPSTMVSQREPPRLSPQKPAQPALGFINPPKFGETTPLKSRLQPANVFNIPKSSQPRPEHHRPAPPAHPHLQQAKEGVKKNVASFQPHQQIAPRPSMQDADVVEIPRPANAPTWNSCPQPAPSYSAFNPNANGFTTVNTYNLPRPVIDLTKHHDRLFSDPALLGDPFGAADPYLYVDAEKANENIKALLEGAFEDEDDKPGTRGRKKKIKAAVEGLTDKLKGLDLKPEEKDDAPETEDEDDVDDGTVEGLSVKLLPHQVEGVEWMKDKEVGVKKKSGILPKGGILADDMGLGKTIQSIALILTNPRPPLSSATSVTDKETVSSKVGKATLVVAPLALIKQWEAEIRNRVLDSHRMRVCVHHGPQRTKRFEDLRKYDVVVTTYQILVSEYSSSSKEGGPQVGCFGIHWYRVILDEAHTIKNRNAKATQACYALRSEFRWCLTGTPMQNNLDELQSLIRFLKIKPYNELSVWKDQITRPMSQSRGGVAIKRLQFYLKAFMKRRTKDVLKKEGALNPGGKPTAGGGPSNGFKITERKIENVLAEFSPEERKFYDRLEQRTDKSLEQMMGGEKMNYASALVLLLRLRQACNHPRLVGGSMAQDKDALTTGQNTGTQSPSKSKVIDNDLDDMANLLGGLSVQTKQCDVCQIELSKDEVSAGSIRCTECEEDLASQGNKAPKQKKHRPSKCKAGKQKERRHKNCRVVLDSSDEEEDGDWIVPESERHAPDLGRAGGSDHENAEGGGESLASYDTSTTDESSIQVLGSRNRKPINQDTTDDEPSDTSNQTTSSESEDSTTSAQAPPPPQPTPTTSAKIRHLLTILHTESPTHKTIVFSQFTSMLDLIEPFLHTASLTYTRYDGSMRPDAREAALTRLRTSPTCRILLCSLKCGSLGLNLTAASRVVILEPFWNPFVEEQAIDRVHRLNQTEDVKVYKLTVRGSVEERILELQEKKRKLAEAAVEGRAEGGKLSMRDILHLFRREAEGDGGLEGEVGLGERRRVLNAGGGGVGEGRAEGRVEGRVESRRVTPPVMEKGRVGGREDPVYGRRW